MFSHVMVGTNDLEKSKTFYDALLGTLGVRPAMVDGHRIFYMTRTGVFSVSKPIDGKLRPWPMAAPSVLPAPRPSRPTRGMRPESPIAGRRVKIRRAFAKAPRANSISLICAISTATRSAPCTGWCEPGCRTGGTDGPPCDRTNDKLRDAHQVKLTPAVGFAGGLHLSCGCG